MKLGAVAGSFDTYLIFRWRIEKGWLAKTSVLAAVN